VEGTLVIEDNDLKVRFKGKKGLKNVGMQKTELAQIFLDCQKNNWIGLENTPVDFELKNGLPSKVRPQGEAWVKPQKQVNHLQDIPDLQAQVLGDFHNPYNFVPALPRDKVTNELGDHQPVGHDRYLPEYWSGSIRVKLTTKTPLLIPDAFQVSEENDHKTFPLRMLNGKPYLPPTSIKGMLRTAYEAVTNSRLSIFEDRHQDRLAFRAPAQVQTVYPAIVVKNSKDGQKYLRILSSSGVISHVGTLPRYQKKSSLQDKGENVSALNYEDSNDRPQHGDKVWVRLNPDESCANSLPSNIRQNLPTTLMPNVVTRIRRYTSDSPPGNGKWYQGWVLITGANINGKRYERVFLAGDNDRYIKLTPDVELLWTELIKNYQDTNQKKLEERRKKDISPQAYLGDDPGETGFSRHVYQSELVKLKFGSLCYVEFDRDVLDRDAKITALLPVTISRHSYTRDPQSLLDRSLQPAEKEEELSPADRVFGWVNQNGSGAYRGNLRIYNVKCVTNNAIKHLGTQGLPLAILGQPKPQQGRFYAAQDDRGTPFAAGVAKHEFYQPGTGLRGRKVYPHHQTVADEYWNRQVQQPSSTSKPKPKLKSETAPLAPIADTNTTREYLRLKTKDGIDRDSQNRSINAWVKPDVTFECSINITNLSSVELGALLWLLSLPPDSFHRLGGGKPLGFGSVAVSVDWEATDLRTGEYWREFYSSLVTIPTSDEFDLARVIADFRSAVEETEGYGKKFAEVSFIKAFCQAARGFSDGKPIHYPRTSVKPNPEGESFKWFTENEAINRNSPQRQYSLGALIDDPGLPIFIERQRY
jgi:CRISPR-associated protein (TIGR03986 family)